MHGSKKRRKLADGQMGPRKLTPVQVSSRDLMLAAIADPQSGAKAFVQKWCVGRTEQAATHANATVALRSGASFTVDTVERLRRRVERAEKKVNEYCMER